MDAYSSAAPLRVVIVPWLAFGHMLPYLELAERLASRGHRVSYVSTPRNLARLPPPASRHFAPTQSRAWTVDLVAIPLPRVDGLAAPFAEFMAAACADVDMRPHWIIADVFHHWAAASAAEHKVPFAMLLPSAAVLLTARAPGVVPGRRYEKAQKALFFDNQGASDQEVGRNILGYNV